MLIFPVDHLPRVIPVGVQTSKGVEEIGFNVSAWLDKWPDMTFEVWPTRPTETAAYPAVCQLIGDVLVWYVSDADTAFEGLGTVEVVGIAEGIRNPSGPCTTEIKKTSLGVTKEPPEGIKPYYEDMMEAAKTIREGLDGLNADLVGSDGYGGLYIVTCNGMKPNRTQAEIRAAVQARKTVLLRAGTRVYTYFQETQSSNYDEAAAGKTCPTFVRPARQEDGGLRYYEVQVHEDDTITDRGKIGKTPNPKKLKLTGAVEAEYDGSEKVEIYIPSGVSDPGTAHLQLVSDEKGKAVWVDRLAYKYTGQVEVMPETALTYMGEDEGFPTHALSTSLMGVLDEGKTYQVNYNDTAYDCPIVSADEGKALVLGKTSVLGFEGGNDDAPFALIVYNDAETIEGMGGIGGMCASFDGATSVTISITGEGTTYKTINEEYLPASAVRKPITLTIASDDTVTADTDFNTAWAMGAQALMDAIVIKQGLADGTRTITPDNVELFENETGLQYIYIRYSSFYYDMEDVSQIPDRGKWIWWHANTLQIRNGLIPGFNPENLRASGTAQAGDYVRYEGNGLLQLVSIDQLKADLGLTSGETTTEDVFYTSDGQTFTTLDGAALHVQKGDE